MEERREEQNRMLCLQVKRREQRLKVYQDVVRLLDRMVLPPLTHSHSHFLATGTHSYRSLVPTLTLTFALLLKPTSSLSLSLSHSHSHTFTLSQENESRPVAVIDKNTRVPHSEVPHTCNTINNNRKHR